MTAGPWPRGIPQAPAVDHPSETRLTRAQRRHRQHAGHWDNRSSDHPNGVLLACLPAAAAVKWAGQRKAAATRRGVIRADWDDELEAGHGEGGWDDDGALRAALRRTAEELGLALPESDGKWGRLAEYVDAWAVGA